MLLNFLFHFRMEPRAEIKNRMGDRWRRLGYEILYKKFYVNMEPQLKVREP